MVQIIETGYRRILKTMQKDKDSGRLEEDGSFANISRIRDCSILKQSLFPSDSKIHFVTTYKLFMVNVTLTTKNAQNQLASSTDSFCDCIGSAQTCEVAD